MSPYLLLLILWVLYFGLHSLFARPRVKDWFARHLRWLLPHYRLLYCLGATLGLVAIMIYNAIISHERLLQPNDVLRYAGLMLTTAGVIVMRQTFRVYSFAAFFGLKPQDDHTADGQGLLTHGILSRIRHPLYAATLLLVLGFWVYIPTLANLITSLSIIIYLFIGIYLEEQDLERQFGQEYLAYKSRVPMLIPRIGMSKG